MPTLKIGENAKIKRNLFYSDGTTPLLLADLASLSAQIVQYKRPLVTYVLGTDLQLVQGDSTSQALIHLTPAVSAMLMEGSVYFRLIMTKADITYNGGALKDIDEWTPFDMEL